MPIARPVPRPRRVAPRLPFSVRSASASRPISATTFTRAFPQAASADSVWATVAFGSAGTADVTLLLDEAGHLTGSSIHGSPSPALRRGIERTLALLGPRTFTAHGASTHLRVGARVGKDDVHDGLHGEVFALSGGSFSGDVGTAFFALPGSTGGTTNRRRAEARALRALFSLARESSVHHDGRRRGTRAGRAP